MKVCEIFNSIDGEINQFHQGRLTTFIRLSGCNLGCVYCDTNHKDGVLYEPDNFDDLVDKIMHYNPTKITLTGGEPLIWGAELITFINMLRLRYYNYKEKYLPISIETNGTIPPDWIPRYVNLVVDYKLNSAGVDLPEDYIDNFLLLKDTDIVKFIVGHKEDFYDAVAVMKNIKCFCNPVFAFSPIHGKILNTTLIKWMQELKIDAVLNIQIHKFIGVQ